MSFVIEYPPHPSELVLTWRAPEYMPDRTVWAIGRIWTEGTTTRFAYFDDDELQKKNLGRARSALEACGFAGYPAFRWGGRPRQEVAGGALEAFQRRVPIARRKDYSDFLEYYGLGVGVELSPLSLLALTGGRTPNDGFALIDPLDPGALYLDHLLNIAGIRHYRGLVDVIRQFTEVSLIADDNNIVDENAVKVCYEDRVIGYISRIQAPAVRKWLVTRKIRSKIVRMSVRLGSASATLLIQVRPQVGSASDLFSGHADRERKSL